MGKVYATKVIEYLQPDDKLYFLGDAIDRGPDGIKIMNKLLTDPRVVYLKGNHEEIMAKAIPDAIERGIIHYYGMHWMQNGGWTTWGTMEHMSDDSKMWYVNKIHQMPTEVIYESPMGHSVILEHAGYSPFVVPTRIHKPLWDRDHFYDAWFGGYDYKGLDPKKTFLVHGHTPIQYLEYDYGYKGQTTIKDKEFFKARAAFLHGKNEEFCPKPEVIRYCDGHKFDIDMCTAASDRIALLDLDTFEVKYFDRIEASYEDN